MTFEEWIESESVVSNFGYVIIFSDLAVELARAAWLASHEAAQQSVRRTNALCVSVGDMQDCKHCGGSG